jgi:hypothetical protein
MVAGIEFVMAAFFWQAAASSSFSACSDCSN